MNQRLSNILCVPELVEYIFGHLDNPLDLMNCACINRMWCQLALKNLYEGSVNDMRYRTPEIVYLNCLLVASRERFAQCMSFVKHLALLPAEPTVDEVAHPDRRFACFDRCLALRNRHDAKQLLQASHQGPVSLAIPFEMKVQSLSPVFDLVLGPNLRSLTIDHVYCKNLASASTRQSSAVSLF